MYMSQLALSLRDPAAQRLLGDLHALHRAVMSAFPTKAERVLFRLEPAARGDAVEAVVLVQSLEMPDWRRERLPPDTRIQTREFGPDFQPGARLRFRLRANPTVKKKPDGRPNGVRVALIGEKDQLNWLHRKGEAGGFAIGPCAVVDEGMISGHRHGSPNGIAFRSVRFEGELTVSDPVRFLQTLSLGIGHGKAFGFGLLSLARATP